MKHTYEVNHEEKEIVVTRAFLKKAGVIGSDAYTVLTRMRADYPTYTVVQRGIAKSAQRRAYGKLTYSRMKEHIEAKEGENADAILKEFEYVKALSKAQLAPYMFVKKWFLTRYVDDFATENEEAA